MLMLQLDNLNAERQVVAANAYTLGRAISHAKSDFAARQALAPVLERAYPCLRAPLPDAPLCLPAHLRAPDAEG